MKTRLVAVMSAILFTAHSLTGAVAHSEETQEASAVAFPTVRVSDGTIAYGATRTALPGDDGIDFLTVNQRFAVVGSDGGATALRRHRTAVTTVSQSVEGIVLTDVRSGLSAWSERVGATVRLRVYDGSGPVLNGPALRRRARVVAVHRQVVLLVNEVGVTFRWSRSSPSRLERIGSDRTRGGFVNDVDSGRLLVTVEGRLRLLGRSGEVHRTFDHRYGQFSPDGARVLLTGKAPRIYNIKAGSAQLLTGFGNKQPYLLQWTADGQIVVLAARPNTTERDRLVQKFVCDPRAHCRRVGDPVPQFFAPQYESSAAGQIAYALTY